MKNKRFVLASRPKGWPTSENFRLEEVPVIEPGEGELLAETIYLSVDPYMRGRMNDQKSYAPSVGLGEVMVGGTVSRVIKSYNPAFAAGDIVEGRMGWQEYGVSDGKDLRKVDPTLAPISTALGVLGMPGMTAYFGLLEIGQPKSGETVVVSGAAGAVGSIVGQIARIVGCRAVGIAGSDDKCEWLLKETGFDAAINYRTSQNLVGEIREKCPSGVDVYFDNVGGQISDAVLANLNTRGRIAICGQISQYNLEAPELVPRQWGALLVKQARAEGFLVFQFADKYDAGLRQMAAWIQEGRITYREQIVDGFENTPTAFLEMMAGANTGKMLVRVRPE